MLTAASTAGARKRICAVLFAVLAAGLAPGAHAAVRPPSSDLASRSYRHPGLAITNVYQPLGGVPDGLQSSLGAELEALGVAPDGAYYDLWGGRWGTLILRQPLIPGSGKGNSLRWASRAPVKTALKQAAWESFAAFLAANKDVLDLDPAEMRARVTIQANGQVIHIHAARSFRSIPVRGAYVTAVLNGGNLVLTGARNWGTIDTATIPAISPESAFAAVASHLGGLAISGSRRAPHLEIVPLAAGSDSKAPVGSGYRHRLVWVVAPEVQGDRGSWEGLVDAITGELIEFSDRNQYVDRTIQGGVFPVSNDGQAPDGIEHAGFPMPYADVIQPFGTGTFANSAGLVSGPGSTLRTTLTGRFVKMNDNCGPIEEAVSCSSLDLGTSGGTDCVVPAGKSPGNTHSSRSGFYELNRLIESAQAWLPGNQWVRERLTSNMNIDDTCNAFWDGSTVNFYRSGGGCGNTGEIAAVFDHEWGHGLDNNNTNPEISSPGEAIADIRGILRLADSCMGRGFTPGVNCDGFGDPCLQCTGVRELDFARTQSGQPHDIDWILSPTVGPGGGCVGVLGTQFGACNQETHCEGVVPAEAGWDLFARDLRGGAFGYDFNTALEVATRLSYVGSENIGQWYQCVPGPSRLAGCNADGGYLNYLAADDDNGDLADGTPHMTAIFAAFDRHQIACATPAAVDSGCAGRPASAPAVTVTPLERAAHLSWNAVAGATRYWVFRTEGVRGCDFGKVKIAETTATEYTDSGLLDGFQYFYGVMAVGANDSCMGPMSACAATTPLPAPPPPAAILAFQEVPDAFAILTGDGDPFLDNCETARLGFKVENAGTIDLHNVRVVSIESTSHPQTQVLTPVPVALAATLPAGCGTEASAVSTMFSFVPHGVAHDEPIVFRFVVTSDETPSPLVGTVTFEGTESDFAAMASKTFSFEQGLEGWRIASGTFTPQAPGANATLTHLASSAFEPNQCDRIQSPRIRLSANSTLSLYNQFETEPGTPLLGFYDRANVGLLDVTSGQRTTVSPDGGRTYNASGGGGACVTQGQPGWAGAGPGLLPSTWTAGALRTAEFAGRQVRLDVTYGTDPLVELAGFQFDEVTVTNLELQVGDSFPDACPAPAPLVARDDAASASVGTPVTIHVLANDSSGSPPLAVTAVTQPAGGTATDNGDGTVTYTSAPSFVGTDTFDYTVCDGAGACATAHVMVTVRCAPLPTAAFSDDFEPAPEPGWTTQTRVSPLGSLTWGARPDPFAHSSVTSFSSDATALDLKDDRLIAPAQDLSAASRLVFWHRFEFENGFDGGVLEVSRDGGATWTDVESAGGVFVQGGYNAAIETGFGSPISGRRAWSGSSEFIDSMTRVEVDLGALAGTGVLVRWRLAGDPIAVGALPGLGWWIDDVEFTSTLETPGECPLPPNAADDAVETRESTPVTVDVLANDTDANGDPLTVTAVTAPAHGTASANGDGTVTYTPASGFVGSDAFQYTVSDGQGGSDTATVSVTVTADPAPGTAKVTGNGWIPKAGGAQSSFSVNAKSGPVSGRVSYDGDSSGIGLKGTVQGLSVTGPRATISGPCTLRDGRSCRFRVLADDNGHPGTGVDRFEIAVTDALGAVIHSAAGLLGGGNIKID